MTHVPYIGELGYIDKTLTVPNPTYPKEMNKDFIIRLNVILSIMSEYNVNLPTSRFIQ